MRVRASICVRGVGRKIFVKDAVHKGVFSLTGRPRVAFDLPQYRGQDVPAKTCFRDPVKIMIITLYITLL